MIIPLGIATIILAPAGLVFALAVWGVSLLAREDTRSTLTKTIVVWLITYAVVIQIWQAIGMWLVRGSAWPGVLGAGGGSPEYGRGEDWLRVTFTLIHVGALAALALYAPRRIRGRAIALAVLFIFIVIGPLELSNSCEIGQHMLVSTSC